MVKSPAFLDGGLVSSSFDVVQENKEKYIKACKELHIVPASYFLRNMTNVRLNMAHHGLGSKGTKAIAIGLMVSIIILEKVRNFWDLNKIKFFHGFSDELKCSISLSLSQ